MDEREAKRVAKLKEKQKASDNKKKSAKSEKAQKAEEERQRRAAVKKQAAKEQKEREKEREEAVKASGGSSSADEQLPEGATYEWKAVNSDPKSKRKGKKLPVPVNVRDDEGNIVDTVETDEDAQRLLGRAGEGSGMLDKDRARQMILDMQRQAEETERRKAAPEKQPADGWKLHKSSSDDFPPVEEQKDNIFDSAAKLVKQAAEAGSEAAADILDAGAEFVEAAASSGSKVVESLAEKLGSAGKLEGDETSGPFARKRKALLKSFERWMTSEHNDWAETYGDEFAKAQREAEQLAREDPQEAERMAWQNEAWLLEELSADRDKMKDVMSHDQLAEVDKMIDLVKSRLENRRAVAGTHDPPASKKDIPSADSEAAKHQGSQHHDEL
ncbi:hypothetical protein CBOM_01120 [Ceraceosorus bombacis]|uniref:Uncharacterized protein n=1 Tax=Ceraceosorus bombacis TaxID=401625 RepID=A0A0P1BBG2_9BASI|nr:hypothetical protein CBOM_01120 [Ceraceosorus bombacis]